MKHLGDITKIHGDEIEPVDVITGGSPCQDLSVAGKRAGLAGERSGLFMEQMRIVKEMRERDRCVYGRVGTDIRPRYMVWENVPGAFSSGKPKGADFAAVIEEIIKVCEPGANVCVCVPDGGWTKSGVYYDRDGRWSVAWRVHDAQFWGVPQRRKRIALVADFGGLSAPEILFERKGLSGDFEPGGAQGQGAAEGTESGADSTICLQGNGIDRADTAGCNGAGWRRGGVTPLTQSTGTQYAVSKSAKESQGGARASSFSVSGQEPCQPSTTNPSLTTANPWDSQSERVYCGDGAWHNISSNSGGGQSRDAILHRRYVYNQIVDGQTAASLTAASGGGNTSGPKILTAHAVDCRNGTENEWVNGTLQSKQQGYNTNSNNVVRTKR